MSKLTKKTYREYLIKITILFILIIILVSSIISCSFKNWKTETWPNEICPINIELTPANPKVLAQITRLIPCNAKKSSAKYKLIINHNFRYENIGISGQNAAKIRPYEVHFTTKLKQGHSLLIKPFETIFSSNEFTSIIKPLPKAIDSNQFSKIVELLIKQIMQQLNEKNLYSKSQKH